MNHKWPKKITDDQLATFKSMWADGKSYKEIEAAIGVSASALGSSRARWGLPARVRAVRNEKNRIAAEVAQVRKITRENGSLEPLPSLAGFQYIPQPAPTDVKIVSHKFLPEHKCGWPLEDGPCGMHCDTPGPYCDEHRKVAHMPRDEEDAAWKAVLGYHPAKR